MKGLWQIFMRHPIAIIFYMAYLWILTTYYRRGLEYQKVLKLHAENWTHSVREDGLVPFIVALIFGLVIGGYAIGAKENKFYLWMLPFIILPIIVLSNI